MILNKEEKLQIIKEFGKNEHDTGSTEVQIAILTREIDNLSKHIIANKKDNSGKRGLQRKVSARKALLAYLERTDINRYRTILERLGLRGANTNVSQDGKKSKIKEVKDTKKTENLIKEHN